MNITTQIELYMVLKASIATVFGILIGLERQKNGRVAGIRTFATIALGTAVFTLLAGQVNDGSFNYIIIAAIIIGAGALSSKMLVSESGMEQDFSNIAAVWATVAISVSICMGLFILSGVAATMLLIIFWFKDLYNKN